MALRNRVGRSPDETRSCGCNPGKTSRKTRIAPNENATHAAQYAGVPAIPPFEVQVWQIDLIAAQETVGTIKQSKHHLRALTIFLLPSTATRSCSLCSNSSSHSLYSLAITS